MDSMIYGADVVILGPTTPREPANTRLGTALDLNREAA